MARGRGFSKKARSGWLGTILAESDYIDELMDMTITVTVDGTLTEAKPEERLADLLNRTGTKIPQVCYHPQLGPIQTCDTCMVEADGKLVRACAAMAGAGMKVLTNSARVMAAQREAFDQILGNHMLYCTVCDN